MEILVVVIIVSIIFLVFAVIINTKSVLGNDLVEANKSLAECQRISNIITMVQAAEAEAEYTVDIDFSIIIAKNNILVGNISCFYYGEIENQDVEQTFNPGTILVAKDSEGIVRVTQV